VHPLPDDDLAFERIVNVPKRGIGDTTSRSPADRAGAGVPADDRGPRWLVPTDELKRRARATALANFIRDFDRWRGAVREPHTTSPRPIVLEESGYTDMWQADRSPEPPGRLENLKELVQSMAKFETLRPSSNTSRW
jgi:DNA helicase-2/ATP-dependent DNA helicase PcrA